MHRPVPLARKEQKAESGQEMSPPADEPTTTREEKQIRLFLPEARRRKSVAKPTGC